MKPDLYTKTVLTVIALSLSWIAAQSALKPPVVSAQRAEVQKVELVDGFGSDVSRGGSLDVHVH